MPFWSKLAIPAAIAVLGLAYFGLAEETACDRDPRGRACFEQILDDHFETTR